MVWVGDDVSGDDVGGNDAGNDAWDNDDDDVPFDRRRLIHSERGRGDEEGKGGDALKASELQLP